MSHLKQGMLSAALMGSGIVFLIAGPATKNVPLLNLFLVLSTVQLLLPEERSCQ